MTVIDSEMGAHLQPA